MRALLFVPLLAVGFVLATTPSACGGADDQVNGAEGEGDGTQDLEYTDAGIPDRPDAGPPVEIEVCVPIAPLPDAQLPRCTAATRDCITACPADETGDACHNACWANDPTPPVGDTACSNCIFTQLLSCLDVAADGVCHAQVAAFLCCAITGAACTDESNEMFTCGFVSGPECFNLTGGDIGRCYADSDPVADAGPDGGT